MDYDALLYRVKADGRLTAEEQLGLTRQLDTCKFEASPYRIIHILGRAMAFDALPSMLPYLKYDDSSYDDPAAVREVTFKMLGHQWKRKEVFESALRAAEEDPDWAVRNSAALATGLIGGTHIELRARAALALLKWLTCEFQPEIDDIDIDSFRDAVYLGVLALCEVPSRHWPIAASESTPLWKDADPAIIRKARSYAQSNV